VDINTVFAVTSSTLL